MYWEAVYHVTGFFDCPTTGIAEYNGHICLFDSLFIFYQIEKDFDDPRFDGLYYIMHVPEYHPDMDASTLYEMHAVPAKSMVTKGAVSARL